VNPPMPVLCDNAAGENRDTKRSLRFAGDVETSACFWNINNAVRIEDNVGKATAAVIGKWFNLYAGSVCARNQRRTSARPRAVRRRWHQRNPRLRRPALLVMEADRLRQRNAARHGSRSRSAGGIEQTSLEYQSGLDHCAHRCGDRSSRQATRERRQSCRSLPK